MKNLISFEEKVDALFRDEEHKGFIGNRASYIEFLEVNKVYDKQYEKQSLEKYVDMLYKKRSKNIERNNRINDQAENLLLNYYINNFGVQSNLENNLYYYAKREIGNLKDRALLGRSDSPYTGIFKLWDYDSTQRNQANADAVKIIELAHRKAYEYIEKEEKEYVESTFKRYVKLIEDNKFKTFLNEKNFDAARSVALSNYQILYRFEGKKTYSKQVKTSQKKCRRAYVEVMNKIAKAELKEIKLLSKEYISKIKESPLYKKYLKELDNKNYEKAEDYLSEINKDISKNKKDLNNNESKALDFAFNIFYDEII